jgi:hypothetical protein
MVVSAYHPATGGNIKQKDHGSSQPGQKVRPYLKNNQRKKG